MEDHGFSPFVAEPVATPSRPVWRHEPVTPLPPSSQRIWPFRTLANFLALCAFVMMVGIAGPLVEASSPMFGLAGSSTQRVWGFQVPEFFLLISGLGGVSLLGLYLGRRESWLVRWVGGLTPVAFLFAAMTLYYLFDLLERASAIVDSFGILTGGSDVSPGAGLIAALSASMVGLNAWIGNKLWRFARWIKHRYL